MNTRVRFVTNVALLATLTSVTQAQTTSKNKSQTNLAHRRMKKPAAPSIEIQLQQMKLELQSQIDDLREKLAAKDAQIEALLTNTQAAQQKNSGCGLSG